MWIGQIKSDKYDRCKSTLTLLIQLWQIFKCSHLCQQLNPPPYTLLKKPLLAWSLTLDLHLVHTMHTVSVPVYTVYRVAHLRMMTRVVWVIGAMGAMRGMGVMGSIRCRGRR